jgi:chorismate synthase
VPLRILTAGESHGPLLTTIIEGMPAGIPLTPDIINQDLARRQAGYGSGGRMQIERDEVRITAGVMNGVTTGGPISLIVENRDFKNWRDKDVAAMSTPRPGHADLTGAIKYGYRDLRIALERASARETTMRVAAGAVCRQFLAQFGIQIGGYVTQIGHVVAGLDPEQSYPERFIQGEASDVRCPDPVATEQMHEAVRQAKIDQDTLGGIMEIVALNVPPGLGSHVHYDRRLDGRLVAAMVSIQAMKGAEVGNAFEQAGWRGSEVHDDLYVDDQGNITRRTNRAGGLEGGITTGDPIVVRVAMKPIATMLRGADSVNLATGEADRTTYERSDFCALPRAIPIGESMMAFVITEVLLEKLGGDSVEEMLPRFASLRRSRVSDVPVNNVSWRFGYV